MSIAGMYAEWIQSHKESKERDPHRLYLSDLGKCPRKIQYRLLGFDKDPQTEQERINKELMFRLAEHIEDDATKMFGEVGALWGFQGPVPIPDRDNWGGRYDILADYNGKRIVEVKTVHPNAFRYGLDYPEHRLQAWSYHHYLQEGESLTEYPILVYFDRGGSNTSQEQVVTPQPIVKVMDELDDARALALQHNFLLISRLNKVLKVRDKGCSIKLEPDSRCRTPYCEYFGTCEPDIKTECWAKRVDEQHPWVPTKKALPFRLEEFMDTLIDEVMS
jgi:CRISPR/Cas system-associated exonuclease Cas4 (RecB family)